VLSFHSLIAIETVEEDRVRSLLMEVTMDLKLPFFEWSLTSGFNLSRDDAVRLVQALQGLTINQARQVIAQAIVAAPKSNKL
jgi:hypothetical protein